MTPSHRKVFDAAAEALGFVLKFEHPADAVLTNYFRQHAALGQHDRAFVAEAVFGILRHKRTLDFLTDSGNTHSLLLAWLARFSSPAMRKLAPRLRPAETHAVAAYQAVSCDALPAPVQAELPDWVYERLAAQMPEAEILALGRTLMQSAPLDLRVNTVRGNRESALQALAASGLEAAATPYSPIGVRIKGKPAINRHPLFLDGTISPWTSAREPAEKRSCSGR